MGNRPARSARRLRVLLAPIEIAGYYASLEAGLRELGVDAVAIDLDANPFRYRDDRVVPDPLTVRLARRVRRPEAGPPSRIRRIARRVARAIAAGALVAWALLRFDAFIFGYGFSLVGLRELPLLRRLGKRVIFVFHGSDARPPYIDGPTVLARPGAADLIELTRRRKAAFAVIERHADAVISQPAFSHLFERPVVDWFVVGMPWRSRPTAGRPTGPAGETVRILHSPSNPAIKGSARIEAAVAELQAQGLPLELIELRGVPNEVVRREIEACDFVVDQLFSDAPMVGFATEAASAGRPAIVGGYAWPENHRILRVAEMPPVEECRPEEIADAIRRLALDPGRREDLGRRAAAFVEGWSAREVAARMLRIIETGAPPEWLFDPRELRYMEGCGLTEADVRASVARVIEAGGAAALGVADKPELEACFIEFAAGDAGGGARSGQPGSSAILAPTDQRLQLGEEPE